MLHFNLIAAQPGRTGLPLDGCCRPSKAQENTIGWCNRGELAEALTKNNIRLANRNPEKVNPTDGLIVADLLNYRELQNAFNPDYSPSKKGEIRAKIAAMIMEKN